MTEVTNLWAAMTRLVLGIAQMSGAATSLYLLADQGVTQLTLFAVVVTCILTSTSVLLFGRRSPRYLGGDSGPDSPRRR